MNKLQKALLEMSELDRLTAMDSSVHRLSPLAKLLVTIVYIAVTVSFGKYDLSGLAVMVLYPVLGFTFSGIPVSTCFYKLRIAIPLVIFVGLFNPFFDKAPLLHIGNVRLDPPHALIDGELARYSVHLGSGVVHQIGGTMIPVLPVHSQHKGKIFLPFADEDPKTAEILSKIILFSEDKKIKDPSVLQWIKY